MNEVIGKHDRSSHAALFRDAIGSAPAFPTGKSVYTRSAEGVRIRLLTCLFALDCLCIIFGFVAASTLHLGSPLAEQALRTLTVVLPMFIALAFNSRSYTAEALERPSLGAHRAIQAMVYACVVAIVLLFYLKWSEQFSRVVLAMGTVISIAALAGGRVLLGNYFGRRYRWTFCHRLVLVDGVPVTPHPGDCIVFADQIGIVAGEDDPLARDRLGELLQGFDRAVLACPPERRGKWSHSLKGCTVDVELLMPELSHLGAMELRDLHGERTLVVGSRPLSFEDRSFKRALDLLVSGPALLLLAPVMLLLAIGVKIDSRGPVFFRQRRVGQNNRMFNMLKFRSMRIECSDLEGLRSASPSDDRLTRFGSFLRRTSLDELPQLFNVLKGEMSIVGPRPHALGSTAEDSLFWQIDRRYFERHAIKPGITGLAQVRGFRGATSRRHDLTKRLQSDLDYVAGWTIWRDLRIIAATFFVLIHPKAF